jgi:hypothetical protein
MILISDRGISAPRFKIGDRVHCYREDTEAFHGFDFHGVVEWVNDTGEGIEYRVTNAPDLGIVGFPLLIWEEEMTLE